MNPEEINELLAPLLRDGFVYIVIPLATIRFARWMADLVHAFSDWYDNAKASKDISKNTGLGLGFAAEDDEEYVETGPEHEAERGSEDIDPEDYDMRLPASARKIVNDVLAYKAKFQTLNRRIKNRRVSEELEQLDIILDRIIERLRNDPSTASCLRRLMQYYLPTTEKLLASYDELEHQPVQGENIITAKQEIKNSLKEFNHALENMLNDMFQDEAFSISADASVMRTMLKQDGLLDEEIYTCNDQEGPEEEGPPHP